MPVGEGNQWSCLRGAIAHGDGEAYLHEECLYLLVESGSANHYLIGVAAHLLLHEVADVLAHFLANARHVHEQSQAWGDEWEYLLANDFLYDERHGYHHTWVNLCHGRLYDRRAGQAGEEKLVVADAELQEKLARHAVHVGHGQDGERVGVLGQLAADGTLNEGDVAPKRAIWQHDSL